MSRFVDLKGYALAFVAEHPDRAKMAAEREREMQKIRDRFGWYRQPALRIAASGSG